LTNPIYSGPTPVIRETAHLETADLTLGEKVIRFIEKNCLVPEGDLVGQPVQLEDFQKCFILAVYDNIAITDTAILSMARKNAKTALIAFLAIAHLVGPVAILNSRIISGARSREQAAEVYNLASKCVSISPNLEHRIRAVPSSKMLVGLAMNTEYKATSAEARTAHGKSPIVAILDEVGQIVGPQDAFVDAITTSQGAYSNPLLIYISTQAASDSDFFSVAIDDALTHKPPKTVCHVYCADEGAEIMDEDQWRQANPALGAFRSEADMRKQAEKAARMPSFSNTFRNLNLNQRVSTVSPFVSRDIWQSCAEYPEEMEGAGVYCGLDLSSRKDLTAFVAVAKRGEHWDVWCRFWAPEEGVHERAKKDRVPYDVWAREGYLTLVPGNYVDYAYVVQDVVEMLGDCEVKQVAYDRWRMDLFRKELDAIGVELPLVPHGQGFKDMAPALDTLEAELLNGRLRHGMNPVLTMCAANAVVRMDEAGNRKLDKHKASGRIDGMVALAMAFGSIAKEEAEPAPEYSMFFV
jgi:phage terminase large subunit-like protein